MDSGLRQIDAGSAAKACMNGRRSHQQEPDGRPSMTASRGRRDLHQRAAGIGVDRVGGTTQVERRRLSRKHRGHGTDDVRDALIAGVEFRLRRLTSSRRTSSSPHHGAACAICCAFLAFLPHHRLDLAVGFAAVDGALIPGAPTLVRRSFFDRYAFGLN